MPPAAPAPAEPAPAEPAEEKPVAQPEPEPASGTVVVMHFRHELTEEMEAQFEDDHPGIEIEFADASEQTRFFAMYAAGSPPDLYRIQAPSIPQFLARGILYDLTPYFEASELINIDDLAAFNKYYMAEGPLETGSGKICGMCKDASPDMTIFANKAHFEEAGLPVPDPDSPVHPVCPPAFDQYLLALDSGSVRGQLLFYLPVSPVFPRISAGVGGCRCYLYPAYGDRILFCPEAYPQGSGYQRPERLIDAL
ncbi:MAG: extracellular solute-binding protein [Chloroflexota bacterium]|nr:extracellular solute-binding protein [Chloroflexota bacterium]